MVLETMINHQKYFTLIFSLVLLVRDSRGGSEDLDAHFVQEESPQLFIEEILSPDNDDSFFNELKKYNRNKPLNLESKWPVLQNLLQIEDYDDTFGTNKKTDKRLLDQFRTVTSSNENLEKLTNRKSDKRNSLENVVELSKLLEKLSVGKATDSTGPVKDRAHKKNVQYMSPCHFKICNMGRKRNARNEIFS